MGIRIASWNINWVISHGVSPDVLKENKHKLKIAKHLTESLDYDVVALLEADSDRNAQLEIEGYQKFYCSRNFNDNIYNWNGILLYVKECYRPRVCEEVLNEFENNKTSCFLPLIITINDKNFHCLFVWTLKSQKEWKNGGEVPYGYNRFCDVLKSEVKFNKTHDFINGKRHNVIVIGDFNIFYKENDCDIERVCRWYNFLKMMDDFSLKRKENDRHTYGQGSNDHCFVSKSLFELTSYDVAEKSYEKVESDHKLICLTLNDIP